MKNQASKNSSQHNQEELRFIKAVIAGLDDAKAGKTYSVEEAKKQLGL